MGFTIDEAKVADFGFYLSSEAGHTLPIIEEFARNEGMSSHGFNGLLEPLGEIVNGDASLLVGSAFTLMQEKLCDLGDALIAAAREYGYTEHQTIDSLLEANGLADGTDEAIDYGGGYGFGYGGGYSRHKEDGASDFDYTDLDLASVDRPDTSYADDIDTGGVLNVLDWIWSEFDVDGGKGFTDSLISPLAGNYNSINANGEAWKSVGKNLGLLAANLGDNATTLLSQHWEGEAAEAFEQFLDVFWRKGAVWAGEQLGDFVAQGFEKIAEVSKQIAQLAVEVIETIIKIARRIATKAIPVLGWAWTAIESASKYLGMMFGLDVDDLYDDIVGIIDTSKAVFALFDSIEQIVTTMEDYFDTFTELVTTVQQIPEVGTLQEAVDFTSAVDENREALEEQKSTLEKQSDRAGEALDTLDELASGAETLAP